MKHGKYIGLLSLLVLFISCTANNDKTVMATPMVKDSLGLLTDSCAILRTNASYNDLLVVSKKGFVSSIEASDLARVAGFAFFTGVAYDGMKKKDSAIFYYNLGEQYGRKANAIAKVIDCQVRLSSIYYESGLADSLNALQGRMNTEADTLKDMKLKMDLVESLAIFYATHSEPQKALAGFFEELKYHKQQNDTSATGQDLNHIGRVYMQIKDNEKGLRYSLEALPYLRNRPKISCLNLVGDNYTRVGKADSGVIYFKKAIDISRSINDSLYLYNSYMQLCDALISLKQYDEVSWRVKEAMAYFDKSHNVNSVIDAYTILADVERHYKNYAGAIELDKKALAYAKSANHNEWQTFLYSEIAGLYGTAGQYEGAYNYLKLYNSAWDSVTKESNRKNIQELETRYQTTQKEQQIKLLNQQAVIKDIDLKDQRRTGWFLLAASCLLLIIVGLVFRGYRIKRKSNELLAKNNSELNLLNQKLNEANQSKTKLFSIISHDLRSPVSSLFNYLQFEKKMAVTETEEQMDKTRTRIKQTASDVLESMEDILFWSKSQMEHFEPNNYPINLKEVFNEVVGMHGVMADQKNITVHTNCSDDITINTDPNFLKIIVRNLLSNSIKFTLPGGNIYLTAQKNANNVQISVRDDGKGMADEQVRSVFEWNSIRSDSSGLGLRLTKEFVDKLNGTITTTSALGVGTTFTVTFAN